MAEPTVLNIFSARFSDVPTIGLVAVKPSLLI